MPYFMYQGISCYYEERGTGRPLLFLHGNTASSRMFEGIAEEYQDKYKVILLDFAGNGRSQRLDRFPVDLWYDQGMQTVEFLRQKDYKNVSLIGSSGGALAAINAALEAPDRIDKVIADSFEGKTPVKSFTEHLREEREASKHDPDTRMFYQYMQGDDWELAVDKDTEAIAEHERTIGVFFHRPLGEIKAEILLTGSREDPFIRPLGEHFMEETYRGILEEIGHGSLYIFDKGGHPAMLTNAEAFIALSRRFLDGGEAV